MSRTARAGRDRKILAYADGLEHGVYGEGNTCRTLAETHRLPHLVGCYALFVAHGGSTAADICARNFLPALMEDENFVRNPSTSRTNSNTKGGGVRPLLAIESSIAAMEAFITSKSTIDRLYYGTTFAFVCIREGRIYSANVGDSRAVLATTDSAIRLTEDHSITSISEARRVKKAGAFFVDGKINGLIHYTRSLGDLHFKSRKHIYFPNLRSDTNTDHIVTAAPHLAEHVLGVDALFLIIASEQIWRVLSDNAACALVKAARAKNEPPRIAARRVVQAAISAGADPISSSCLVILLDDSNPLGASRDRYSNITSPRNSARHRNSNMRNSGTTNTSASSSAGIEPSYLGNVSTPPPRTKRVPVNIHSSVNNTLQSHGNEDDFFGGHTTPPPRRAAGSGGLHYNNNNSVNHGDRSPATPRNQKPLALSRALSEDEDFVSDDEEAGMTIAITSPTTPPVRRKARAGSTKPRSRTSSSSTRNAVATTQDLYSVTGRGRKQRVLVPIANWGVAPGGKDPLKNIVFPAPHIGNGFSSANPNRGGDDDATVDMAALDINNTKKVKKKSASARKPRASRSAGISAADAVANDYNNNNNGNFQHPISPPLKTNGDREPIRQDSFGVVHSSLFTPPRPKRSSSAPRTGASNTGSGKMAAEEDPTNNARVSHLTTSSGKTGGESTELRSGAGNNGNSNNNSYGIGFSPRQRRNRSNNTGTNNNNNNNALDELPGTEFGRGGPAKVRYREHDLFGFLRRRSRPASRHG